MSQYGRVRLRAARARTTSGSSRTTTAAPTLGRGAGRARPRAARRGPEDADGRLPARRSACATARARSTSSSRARYAFGPGLRLALEPGTLDAAAGPARLHRRRRRRCALGGKRYRGSLEVASRTGGCARSTPSGSRRTCTGVVPRRGAARLAGRGAEGAGRRRALVRARRAQDRGRSTSTPTCAARSTAASTPRSRPTNAAVDATAGQVRAVRRARSRRRTSSRPRAGGRRTSPTSGAGRRSRTSSRSPTRTTPPRRTTAGARSPSPRRRLAQGARRARAGSLDLRDDAQRAPARVEDARARVGTGGETSVPATDVRAARSASARPGSGSACSRSTPLAKPVVYGGGARARPGSRAASPA